MSITNPKLAVFFSRGMEFIAEKKAQGTDPCEAITPGTREWNAWGCYFRDYVGAYPAAFRNVEKGRLESFTVPAKWPEWFDSGYAPPGIINYRAKTRPQYSEPRTPEEIERHDKLMKLFTRPPKSKDFGKRVA